MKRTILAMMLLGSSCALFAQNTPTTTNTNSNTNNNQWNTTTNSSLNNSTTISTTNASGTLSSTGSYSAYGTAASVNVPMNVQTTFQMNYPAAAGTNVTWQQVSPEWWRASYGTTGQYTNVMYNPAGQSFLVAVPVLQTSVPQEVVDKAYQMHGITLYDIKAMRGSNGQEYYTVRFLDNGQVQSESINADGTAYMDVNGVNNLNSTSANAALADTTTRPDMHATMNHDDHGKHMGEGKVKHKTKDAHGNGYKTKYKNGELKKHKEYKKEGSTDATNGTNNTNGGGY